MVEGLSCSSSETFQYPSLVSLLDSKFCQQPSELRSNPAHAFDKLAHTLNSQSALETKIPAHHAKRAEHSEL